MLGEGEQGEAAVAMLAKEGLDLVPGPARASRRGARHAVLGLHLPMLPDHPAPTHDGPAGWLFSSQMSFFGCVPSLPGMSRRYRYGFIARRRQRR